MPFLQDDAWPSGLLTIFNLVGSQETTFEDHRYDGAYDRLLNYCFGDYFTFYVGRVSPPGDNNNGDDFIAFSVVFNANRKPVLIADIKGDAWARKAELRFRADKHIRDHYALMLGDSPLPRLWGLSFLGTKLRIYCGDTKTYALEPEAIPRPSADILPSTFLNGEWDLDILSPEGFVKMQEIVRDIVEHTETN